MLDSKTTNTKQSNNVPTPTESNESSPHSSQDIPELEAQLQKYGQEDMADICNERVECKNNDEKKTERQGEELLNQNNEIKLPLCREIQEFVLVQQQIGQTIQLRKRIEKQFLKQQEKLQNNNDVLFKESRLPGIADLKPINMSDNYPYNPCSGPNPMMLQSQFMQQFNYNPYALQASLMQQMMFQQFMMQQMYSVSNGNMDGEQLPMMHPQFNNSSQVMQLYKQHEQLQISGNIEEAAKVNIGEMQQQIGLKESQSTKQLLTNAQVDQSTKIKNQRKPNKKIPSKGTAKIPVQGKISNQKVDDSSRKTSQQQSTTGPKAGSKGETNYSQYQTNQSLTQKSTSQEEHYYLNNEDSKLSSVTFSEMNNDEEESHEDIEDGNFKPSSYKTYQKPFPCCHDSEGIGHDQQSSSDQINVLAQYSSLSNRPQRNTTLRANQNKNNNISPYYDHIDNYQLVQCSQYKSFSSQPYQIYISQEALIMLNIHAHLSKNEVIGFLGGYSFTCKNSDKKYIIIKQAYPCDSIVENFKERQKNCEMCPESAANARQQIQNNAQQIIGWYHSHPFFRVEPSSIDIRNHAIYQQNFDMEQLPFIALIVGPYSVQKKNDSLIKIFHINKNVPHTLSFKYIPSTKLRKNMLQEMKDLFEKYIDNLDSINMKDKWTPKITRKDKLIKCLEIDLQKNHKLKEEFNLQEDILQHLKQEDKVSYFMRDNGTWNTAETTLHGGGTGGTQSQSLSQNKEKQDTPMIGNQLSSESLVSKSTASDELGNRLCYGRGKESYFSIETQEKITRFISKVLKSMQRTIFRDSIKEEGQQEEDQDLCDGKDNKSGGGGCGASCTSSTKGDECPSNTNQLSQQISSTQITV